MNELVIGYNLKSKKILLYNDISNELDPLISKNNIYVFAHQIKVGSRDNFGATIFLISILKSLLVRLFKSIVVLARVNDIFKYYNSYIY